MMAFHFHEAREALATAEREWTSVGSLNATASQAPLLACEVAVNELWRSVKGNTEQYQGYPRHKPGQWVEQLGIKGHFTSQTQKFLTRIDSYAMDKARYEGTAAFTQHTSKSSQSRGGELIEGARKFIEETESLGGNPDVIQHLQNI